MESQIEKISAVEYRVRVEIPWETVSPRLNAKLRDLRKKARLPGFRPGKVPQPMLERLYGKSIREELARELVDETFQDAVVKHSKVPLTQPALENNDLSRGSAFTYSARFEVPPEIEPTNYTGVPVRRRPAVIDEAKVDERIKAKQEELTEIQPLPEDIERTQTEDGDVWTVDIEGAIGATRISRKDAQITVGDLNSEIVPGLMEIIAALALADVGSTREVRFMPTQERLRTDLRGQEAVFTLGYREVRRRVVPVLDDEFARDTGDADTLGELRAKYGEAVKAEDQEQAEHEARQRLVETILGDNDFEVAPSLVAREVEAQVDLFKRQLAQQGLDLNRVGMTESAIANQMRPQATFNVKAFLLLDAIGKAEDITFTEDEVNEELANMAAEGNQNVDRMRATMEKNGQLLLLRAQIRESKILDFLMEKAEVTEAPDPAPEAETAGEATEGGDAAGAADESAS